MDLRLVDGEISRQTQHHRLESPQGNQTRIIALRGCGYMRRKKGGRADNVDQISGAASHGPSWSVFVVPTPRSDVPLCV